MIRLEGRYILPDSQDFETAFVTMLRFYLFRKYFSEVNSVYEFGCGTGLNLVALARMFPDKRLFGLDWSRVSCEIIDKIAQTKKMNLNGVLFDMFEPDYKLKLAPGSAVFTIGAMEQLGKNFAPFLSFLLKKKPSICINIETLYELYSPDSLFDYAAAKYIEKRGYLQGYLSRLRQLEQEKKVQIIKVQRTFGNLYHDGYSFVIWRPRG
jgi:cyclopropane fatty-acyl-phospholipid synthase-like methyltransferase